MRPPTPGTQRYTTALWRALRRYRSGPVRTELEFRLAPTPAYTYNGAPYYPTCLVVADRYACPNRKGRVFANYDEINHLEMPEHCAARFQVALADLLALADVTAARARSAE
jgi:hypothetical protein